MNPQRIKVISRDLLKFDPIEDEMWIEIRGFDIFGKNTLSVSIVFLANKFLFHTNSVVHIRIFHLEIIYCCILRTFLNQN